MHYGYGYFEEGHLGKIQDLRLWKRLFPYLRPHGSEIGLAVVLSLLISAADLTLPYLLRLGVDRYITAQAVPQAQRLQGLSKLAALFGALMAVGFAAEFFQVLLLEWTGQRIMHRLRQDLFRHVIGLDLPFFRTNPVGKLVTRLTNDIQNMHEMFTSVIVTVFNDLLRIVGILCVLFWMDASLTAILIGLIPIMLGATLKFSLLAREAFRRIRTRLAQINAFLQEVLAGLSVLQIFGREADTLRRFADLNEAHRKAALHQIHLFGLFVPFIEVLNSAAVAVIIWYGGGQALRQAVSLGVLVAFISYIRLFFRPLRELSQKFSIVQSALASAERIFELMDTRPDLPAPPAPKRLEKLQGTVTFQDVTFGYDPDRPVLRNVSFHVDPGRTLAIVGPTGAGKTTLINLLERFYDPLEGRVLVDGCDLRTLDPAWWRRRMGLVMQDVFIVPGTLRENVCLDADPTEARLRHILELAQLSDLVEALPLGLDTPLGEGGIDLSAGQKQLLSFARMLARDPVILILDEATSNVDSETEMRIQRAIHSAMAGRTSIVIAHRLSTIRRADRILVLDGGRIVEEGTHEELMEKKGLYHHLILLDRQKVGHGTVPEGRLARDAMGDD
ncbi:ATP-binding cassette, subfamily B [Desulfacinum hydrothermale DSM 13146]|uniref:ATP-binding cassette, subfamily B n=1 Tax=Desulfacinum hydrothermale DSM 13146 TaxID=1121390 RepID=A0A1W1X9F7_9BACT|nr:ABC transporter ATP-binding protein [Desulfacinum hydrothermale]SMC20612.1 ATP-binding cassette, subfamily B [Desulfacinum hydrothermale DSM 13146]